VTENKVVADQAGLAGLVSTLHNGAEDLGSTASPAPSAPDAGRSSANVGAALSAIMKSVASLIALSQDSGNKINTNSGAYGSADNQVDTGFQGILGNLTNPN
jgi:hypothetical protein